MRLYRNKNTHKQKQLAHAIKQHLYRVDPIRWAVERFGEKETSFLWEKWGDEYKNHKWDGTPNPFYAVTKALSQGKDVGIESGTGTGKTYTAPISAYWFLDCFPESLVICTAPTKDQLEAVLWKELSVAFPKFKKLRKFSGLYTTKLLVDDRRNYDDESDSVKWMIRAIVAQKRAGAESAIKFQGHHQRYQLFIMEEGAGIDFSVYEAIKHTNMPDFEKGIYNMCLAFGNPDSQLDPLHQFCERESTEHIRISSLDHPNIVLGTTVIPGAVTRQSIEIRKKEYGEESPFYQSRVRGIAPSESVDSLIKKEWVDKCNINGNDYISKEEKEQISYDAVGVDVANSSSGDKGAVGLGKGCELIYLKDFQCPDSNFLAYNLLEHDYEVEARMHRQKSEKLVYGLPKIFEYGIIPECCGVDVVGVGAGTINTMKEKQYNAIGLQGGGLEEAYLYDNEGRVLYKFKSLRAQMYFEAMKDLQKREIIINIDNKTYNRLIKELTTPKYKVSDGYIILESKEQIKERLGGKSPNLADAFVYWNWMRKGYYVSGGEMPFY